MVTWVLLAGLLSTMLTVVMTQTAKALSPVLLADWEMNEAPGSPSDDRRQREQHQRRDRERRPGRHRSWTAPPATPGTT